MRKLRIGRDEGIRVGDEPHMAISPRPPISFSGIGARTKSDTYAAKGWPLCIVQEPSFCRPIVRFVTFTSLYVRGESSALHPSPIAEEGTMSEAETPAAPLRSSRRPHQKQFYCVQAGSTTFPIIPGAEAEGACGAAGA
jgi:hypothetical protein